jgi:hypothetical protein
MTNLIDLTKQYINAFDSKNLIVLEDFFIQDAILFDPANPTGVKGKEDIINMISNLFKEYDKLHFTDNNIFIDKDTTIIEFELNLGQKKLVGVDIIKWQEKKVKELRAYLY